MRPRERHMAVFAFLHACVSRGQVSNFRSCVGFTFGFWAGRSFIRKAEGRHIKSILMLLGR